MYELYEVSWHAIKVFKKTLGSQVVKFIQKIIVFLIIIFLKGI